MIDETVEQIADMRTHSSSEVAIIAVEALRDLNSREYATVEEFMRSLSRNCRTLRQADPSHASLFNATKAIERSVTETEPSSVDDAKSATLSAIDDQVATITQAKERAAEQAAQLITPGATYLTIDYSTTLLATLERADLDPDEPVTFYTMEARPRYLGRKMARALAEFEGIEPRLIVDSAHGQVLEQCDGVFIGFTCVVDDMLYNRVGTLPLALTADRHGVDMYALGGDAKIVDEAFVFSSDERPPSEVSLEPLDGVTVENISYDATPVSLLSGVITGEGITFAGD